MRRDREYLAADGQARDADSLPVPYGLCMGSRNTSPAVADCLATDQQRARSAVTGLTLDAHG